MLVGYFGPGFNLATMWDVDHAKETDATPVDIIERIHSYVILIDMPGLKSVDIKVQVEDNNGLVIRGESKRVEEEEDVKYLRMRRKVGMFMYMFVLPKDAKIDAVSALYQDGVLRVTVEKLSVLDHLLCNKSADDPNPELASPRLRNVKTIEVKTV
jgi:HSP20 family molecular chaperone IbpA